jgi:hypothetical protein
MLALFAVSNLTGARLSKVCALDHWLAEFFDGRSFLKSPLSFQDLSR